MYSPYLIARRLRQAPQKAFTAIVHQIGVISVALGLAVAQIACLVMQGFQENIEQKLTSFGGHVQVTKYSLRRTAEVPPLDRSQVQGLQAAFPNDVRSVHAFAYKPMLLKATEDVEGVLCKGLDHQSAYDHLRPYLEAGQFLDLSGQDYSQGILLSTQIARRLQVQVGDDVLACVVQQPPRYRKLKVQGLYATHIQDLDEKLAFCDLRLIQRLNSWPANWVGGYEVFLNDWQRAQPMAEVLLDWLDYDLGAKTMAGAYTAIFDWLAIMRQNVYIFMTLILLVASSNLASIILIQMMERTSMLGILKALGASDAQIRHIVLGNNLHMVAQGVCWGNLVGLGLCALQSYWKPLALDPTYYYIHYVPIVWNWPLILGINALTIVTVTIVLYAVIALILRLRPVRAIQQR